MHKLHENIDHSRACEISLTSLRISTTLHYIHIHILRWMENSLWVAFVVVARLALSAAADASSALVALKHLLQDIHCRPGVGAVALWLTK